MRTPRELIVLYWDRVWNDGELELVREICADPILRHDAQSVTALSHDAQIERIRYRREQSEPYFTHEVLLADDTFVCSVWNAHTRKGDYNERCGIEVFKVENGRFVDCWNSGYLSGQWGREGDPSVPQNLPPPALLHSVDEISPQWVQSLFAQAGVESPLVTITRVEPIGHGNVNKTVKVSISYNVPPKDAPPSLIAKFHPETPRPGGSAERLRYYEREAAVYRFLGPNSPVQIPRAYLAQTNEDVTKLNLVLEDLSTCTRPGDQIAGATLAEAEAVIDQLAALHGRYLGSRELEDVTWGFERYIDAERMAAVYASGAAIFRERYGAALSARALETIEGFRPRVGDWCRRKPEHLTLVHGDARVDNVLFGTDAAGAPSAYLIDWQITRLGDPQFDVAYFLTGSLAPAERRKCEESLVRRHAARLRERRPDYSDDVALAAYRVNTLAGLLQTVGAANNIVSSSRADAMLVALVERNCAAVADWSALDVCMPA